MSPITIYFGFTGVSSCWDYRCRPGRVTTNPLSTPIHALGVQRPLNRFKKARFSEQLSRCSCSAYCHPCSQQEVHTSSPNPPLGCSHQEPRRVSRPVSTPSLHVSYGARIRNSPNGSISRQHRWSATSGHPRRLTVTRLSQNATSPSPHWNLTWSSGVVTTTSFR